ncbi:MAG: hypothetical protein Q8P67_02030, partial [archaeon]|nr:hypothetical protein [archaeon]
VDQVATMSTYTSSWPSFQTQLSYALQTTPLSKLTVGLETTVVDSADLSERFQMIQANNISRVAVWTAPVPSTWIPFLKSFVSP